MARENQGHMIAIIVLALLTVVLGICTYLGFSGLAENADLRAAAEADKTRAEARVNGLDAYTKVLKRLIGVEGTPAENPDLVSSAKSRYSEIGADIDKVVGEFTKDMATRIRVDAAQDLTYKGLLEDYSIALAERHDRINSIENQKDKLIEESQAAAAKHEAEASALKATVGDLQAQLKAEKDRNAEQEQKLNQQVAQITAELTQTTNALRNEQTARQTEVANLNNTIAALNKDLASLKREIQELTRVNTDVADGRISMVAPTSDLVYIDLGSADGLRLRQRFSVYDRTESVYDKYLSKAFVEVIEIQGPHRASARVIPQPAVEDVLEAISLDLRNGLVTRDQANTLRVQVLNKRKELNPVLSGDYILSDVWDPGYAVSVALAGNVDIDGDGISDLATLESKIQQNGGQVVAKHDAAGNITGAIDINTRYIIVGDEPAEGGAMKAYTELLDAAQRFNVQQKSVRELYNALGFQGEARTEHMNRDIGRKFEPRVPPRPGDRSAYEDN